MKAIPKKNPPAMTDKQVAVLKALIRRNPDGSLLDVAQLVDKVPGAGRIAMLFTLKNLMGHGLVMESDKVIRDGRLRSTFCATTAAYAWMHGKL